LIIGKWSVKDDTLKISPEVCFRPIPKDMQHPKGTRPKQVSMNVVSQPLNAIEIRSMERPSNKAEIPTGGRRSIGDTIAINQIGDHSQSTPWSHNRFNIRGFEGIWIEAQIGKSPRALF
jgi:hypothetical protein